MIVRMGSRLMDHSNFIKCTIDRIFQDCIHMDFSQPSLSNVCVEIVPTQKIYKNRTCVNVVYLTISKPYSLSLKSYIFEYINFYSNSAIQNQRGQEVYIISKGIYADCYQELCKIVLKCTRI